MRRERELCTDRWVVRVSSDKITRKLKVGIVAI
jgi:hypothetical protein